METRNITVPQTAAYLQELYCQKDPLLAELRQKSGEIAPALLLPEAEALLHQLLLLQQPRRILEIGTAAGYSAACFARWLPQAQITTIEALPELCTAAEKTLSGLGFSDRTCVLEGDARQVLAGEAVRGKAPFDFIFIDAAKSHYAEFWNLCLPLMARGCLIVSDNVLFKGLTASADFEAEGKKKRKHRTIARRLRTYLTYLTQQEGLLTSVLAAGDGLAITIVAEPEGVLPCNTLQPQTEKEDIHG